MLETSTYKDGIPLYSRRGNTLVQSDNTSALACIGEKQAIKRPYQQHQRR